MSAPANPPEIPYLVVIGASAGGVEALQALVASLPAVVPAAILVVLHMAAGGTSVLPQILSRRGPLPVAFARDGEVLKDGRIYVAPSDFHLLVEDSNVRLSSDLAEKGHRPAIDPLFRSAAAAAGPRAIGVILSGMLSDGATGLRAIHDGGGATVVQDPGDAMFPEMPEAAIRAVQPDRIATASEMGAVISSLLDERRRAELDRSVS